MGELELGGKRVIVTGAAGGLGRAFAEAFAAAGASVVAADIDVAGAEETARLIAAKGGRALPQAVDVTDLASAERLARVAHEGLGGADVLVNNAAVYAGLQRTVRIDFRSGMGSRDERQREGHLDHDQGRRAAASRVRRRRDRQCVVGDRHERIADVAALCLLEGSDHRHDPGARPRARRQ
jgi:NAD(P)-dependent dehydrogenase (short-subunit alcohol dehydrogenase family)